MDLFASLKGFFKINAAVIDNNIFRLHYKATVLILAAFSILVTGKQYIGDPIDCLPKSNIPEKMLDTFCWIHTTFSVPDSWHKTVGVDVAYAGVDTYKPGQKRIFHAYYQWVAFLLFLQAVFFYIPRYVWKVAERGRVKILLLELNSPIMAEETQTKNRKLLVQYMVDNLNNNGGYFVSYIFAEVLNFVNVVGQMFLMDAFLGGEFSTYGVKVIQFTGWDWSLRVDPMMMVFPRVAKCNFHEFGSGGSVELRDTLCILPINIINEKIYVFLWFWFVILAILSGLVLVYRMAIVIWPEWRVMITHARVRIVNRDHLHKIVSKCGLGDWFLLDLLSKNLEPLNFKAVVADYAMALDGKSLDV